MTDMADTTTTLPPAIEEVARGVYGVRDTCNVYLIVVGRGRREDRDRNRLRLGARARLPRRSSASTRITDVLMTHHHRDQGQGLPLAVEHGALVHVPPVEVELFAHVDEMWKQSPAR